MKYAILSNAGADLVTVEISDLVEVALQVVGAAVFVVMVLIGARMAVRVVKEIVTR